MTTPVITEDLRGRGLAATAGRVPRPHSEGRGGWAYRWTITDKGRELLTGGSR